MANAEVSIISKHMVRPSPRSNEEEESPEMIHLTPSDLKLSFVHYIQKGLLFHKPHHQPISPIISNLLSSFSQALNRFYPLAGRFVTTHNSDDDDDDNSISISLRCTSEGAEFIHASASHITVSTLVDPCNYTSSSIVRSFFPLNGLLNYEGHSHPLLGVQVTQLADGIFIACSLNHSAGDGHSFWNFFNTWSNICRTGGINLAFGECPRVLERWLPDSCSPPVRLSSAAYETLVRRAPLLQLPPVRERVLHFSSANIKTLKAKANQEMGSEMISSLQALLAHVWRSVNRAQAFEPMQETAFLLLVGFRSRVTPVIPETYLGNSVIGVPVAALAGEMESKGFGWTAWILNQAIASQNEEAVKRWFESWIRNPRFFCLDDLRVGDLSISSSPRFNVYGNDFGWGRPVAVRSGPGNKVEGKMTVYPGVEEGSIDLEVSLDAKVLTSLLEDGEFMKVVD